MKSLIIGITGGSGSGKSRIAEDLLRSLSPHATILALDNYYYPIAQQPLDHNNRPNFDLPESIDLQKFKEQLTLLANGSSIEIKEYTFNNPDLQPRILKVGSKPIIIVEGLFIFHLPEMESLIDVKIYIDVEEDIKLNRRLKRDTELRGYNINDVNYCHINHVLPSYNMFILKQRDKVDFVLPNNGDYPEALNTVRDFLKTKLDPTYYFLG
ncbi:MAG: uridine kinase [Opitutaceae bacterium]|nr:uridine kinase [Cytophagales bacterium]